MNRIMRWIAFVAIAGGLSLLVASCGSKAPGTSGGRKPQGKETISALVPCGQVGPFSEAEKLFVKANPGVEIEWVPENMVTIVNKILGGKERPDAVLSMGDLELNKLEEAGLLVEGTRTKYAENSLAITVPASNPGEVHSLADLTRPAVKVISIANPQDNSVGMHAVEALKGAGLWARVEKKIVYPQYAADSHDVVQKQQAQASIAYYPCVTEVHIKGQPPAQPKEEKMVAVVPQQYYRQFWCEGAVVKGAKNPEGGKRLIEFLKQPEVARIFQQWHFQAGEEKPAAQGRPAAG